MKEIWTDIFGFDGKYQISNFGNIKSVRRERYSQQTRNGYKIVTLFNGKHKRTVLVHRLVALHFIPNPGFLEEVNHIDGNKSNNKVTNLEWCTHSKNILHAVKTGLQVPHNARPVICIDKYGKETFFESIIDASKKMSINSGSISTVCKGSEEYRHTVGGYKWRYATENEIKKFKK